MNQGRNVRAIVAVAGDPGGGAALAPVLERLREEEFLVQPLAYRQALTTWEQRGLRPERLPEAAEEEEAVRRLRETTLLLTATSLNGIDWEKTFTATAGRLGIPSVAVLDFWSNYRPRFADGDGNLTCLPDRIAVMDEQARREMSAEGFPPERLVVTGQPAFEELEAFRARAHEHRQAARAALGVDDTQRVVLFASQPLAALFGEDRSNPLYPGYTEHEVRLALRAALEDVNDGRLLLVIRPHPRENAEELREASSARVRVVVDGSGDRRAAVLGADLVVGMSSVLLVEACLLGRPVVSLQPGLCRPDPLPTNRWGASAAVYRGDEIGATVRRVLLDPAARAELKARCAGLPVEPGATGRIVELVKQLIFV